MTIPYPMPDAFTEDADGNTVPVRNLIPRHTARGRFYEDGPFNYCDQADVHVQPCACALPALLSLRGKSISIPIPDAALSSPAEGEPDEKT